MSNQTINLLSHPESRDLLAAIAAEPLDDAVRLVLADWLEEHGDGDRATFIRLQLERARLHEHDPRAVIIRYEENALLARHRRTWLAEQPEWLRRQIQFERGLPGKAEIKASEFLEHAGEDWSLMTLHELDLKN